MKYNFTQKTITSVQPYVWHERYLRVAGWAAVFSIYVYWCMLWCWIGSFVRFLGISVLTLLRDLHWTFNPFLRFHDVDFFGGGSFFPTLFNTETSEVGRFSSYFGTYWFMPDYSLISYFAIISTVIALALLILPLVIRPSTPGFEKNSSYECGFEPFVCKNEVFESHFLVVGVLFLLFDLELIFLFPLAKVPPNVGPLVAIAVLPFLSILFFGFIFEWVRGALLWPVFYGKRDI